MVYGIDGTTFGVKYGSRKGENGLSTFAMGRNKYIHEQTSSVYSKKDPTI